RAIPPQPSPPPIWCGLRSPGTIRPSSPRSGGVTRDRTGRFPPSPSPSNASRRPPRARQRLTLARDVALRRPRAVPRRCRPAPAPQGERLAGRLAAAGAVEAEPAMLELARILAGWPRLGAEVDDKTIPQEVRFDEIGGVSYTKGCYTGQETVARLHFRGHANRQ